MANVKQEVAQNIRALRRAFHLGVKLHSVQFALVVAHCRNRAIRRMGKCLETDGQLCYVIGVAHKRYRFVGNTLKQHAGFVVHKSFYRAVFAYVARLYFAAKRVAHQLHSVANAQDRDTELKQFLCGVRRVFGVNAVRTARQNNTDGGDFLYFFHGGVACKDLRIHLLFPHAAGNKFLVLSTEVQHQYGLFLFHLQKPPGTVGRCPTVLFLLYFSPFSSDIFHSIGSILYEIF